MSEYLNPFLDWIQALPALWAYLAILAIAYGENVVPPIPGDVIVVFGGYLAAVGKLSFINVVVLSTIGGALGFMTMYAIGYKIGDAVMDPDRLRWLPKDKIGKTQEWLERWGYGVVLVNRFLSGLRSVISITVGMAHVPVVQTAICATVSAAVWTGLIAYGGYAVGENWEKITIYLRDYGRVVLGLILLLACVQLVRLYLKRKESRARRRESGNFKGGGG